MKIQKPWTKEEESFLMENYKRKGINFCIEHLQRNKSSIYNKAFNLKLQTKTENTGNRSKKPIHLKNIKGYSCKKKDEIIALLKEGKRLVKPRCDEDVYQWMLKCWLHLST
jgi:hypothetical protein